MMIAIAITPGSGSSQVPQSILSALSFILSQAEEFITTQLGERIAMGVAACALLAS